MVEDRNEYRPDLVSPPGETLSEMLEERSMTQADLAARTGRPRKTINEIVKGKAAITPDTALQFEKVFGTPATFWLDRERFYQEHMARRREGERLAKDVEWLQELPVADMVKKSWIRRYRDKAAQVRECLQFFGVASSEQWRGIYAEAQVAYRKSPKLRASPGAIAAWLRKGELEAELVRCLPFDVARFRTALTSIRAMTREAPEQFVPKLRKACSDAGVAVVFVPEVKGCRCWGVTRWLSPIKALIQLSLRYKTDDHLWFTFFHEAGHILLHGKKNVFLEGDGAGSEAEERQANTFAADYLIPPAEYRDLRTRYRSFSRDGIELFARRVGVSPGIVVGRLQHDQHLPRTHLNGLKMRIEWASLTDR
jgi:addiction module HigA family antidote